MATYPLSRSPSYLLADAFVQRQYNEDLFESTKMTFGEHLDELRQSLLKAVLALVIGVLIGLLFANKVVEYVQTPLKNALEQYYSNLGGRRYRQELEERASAANRFRKI